MKAIKINNEIKVFNLNRIPKEIKVFLNKIGVETASPESLLALGIRELIYPSKTELQKYDNLTNINDLWLIGNEYVVPVIDFTQEEIAVIAQREEDNDISAQKELKYRSDGEEAYMKMKIYIRRQLDKGNITPTQFNNIYESIRQELLRLNFGDWDIAQANWNAITPPNNLQEIYNTIKNKLDTYITNNM